MRKVKILIAATVMAFSSLVAVAGPAGAVVCHEEPGSCCGSVTVLGKEYVLYNC